MSAGTPRPESGPATGSPTNSAASSTPDSAIGSSNPAEAARPTRFAGGIFWRTLFLIALLIGISLAAWFQSFRIIERVPRAQQIAQTIISVVNVTRAALIYSDPKQRSDLLEDLANNESIRIYPLEPDDKILPVEDTHEMRTVQRTLHQRLGKGTKMAQQVNGQDGLWVSFSIEDDEYWVAFARERVAAVPGVQWLRWGAIALGLSLVGAIVISRLINAPLQRLTATAVAIGRGQRPEPLPDRGPREIRDANAGFNAMVVDLQRIESDRALMLAGISHDLRTPLTRLRLESEMSGADDATRAAMNSDIEQMDAIIGQFLDYARPPDSRHGFEALDLGALATAAVDEMRSESSLRVDTKIDATRPIRGNPVEIKRLIHNLLENARRYGRSAEKDFAEVALRVFDDAAGGVAFELSDRGPGIPPNEIERLKRPFTRLDSARGQASGSGLGLAIVERIAQRHGARFEILNAVGGGLIVRVRFPAA